MLFWARPHIIPCLDFINVHKWSRLLVKPYFSFFPRTGTAWWTATWTCGSSRSTSLECRPTIITARLGNGQYRPMENNLKMINIFGFNTYLKYLDIRQIDFLNIWKTLNVFNKCLMLTANAHIVACISLPIINLSHLWLSDCSFQSFANMWL